MGGAPLGRGSRVCKKTDRAWHGVHTFRHSTPALGTQRQVGLYESKSSLIYTVSSTVGNKRSSMVPESCPDCAQWGTVTGRLEDEANPLLPSYFQAWCLSQQQKANHGTRSRWLLKMQIRGQGLGLVLGDACHQA